MAFLFAISAVITAKAPIDHLITGWTGYVTPMTYFLDIMRGIMFKGVGVIQLQFSFLGLFAYCTVAMLLVSKNKSIMPNLK